MTATDELRAMLDDAGVEWHVSNESGATFWTGQYGIGYYARENKGEETLRILGVDLTPAQAIEATLGRGELERENTKLRELVRDMWRDGMCECDERGACAECEYHFPDRMRELGVEVVSE